MARPLSKKTVDVTQPAVRVSRIRRDPPPKVKTVTAAEIKERNARMIVLGVAAFALALFAILVGISSLGGWSMSRYTIDIRADE